MTTSFATIPPRIPTRSVGILGGMGPAAGADFVRLFVQACIERMQKNGQTVNDQAFPDHWLAQAPVPDRSLALSASESSNSAPLEAMAQTLERLESVGVHAVAIACNTAHAWHAALQARVPDTELLHISREVACYLQTLQVREVGLMATQGTYLTGLYDAALDQAGIICHRPNASERETLMRGIYDGVKIGKLTYANTCFVEVAQQMTERHGDISLIMGCTEIPLALESASQAAKWKLINPAQVLARALASRAYAV